MEGPRNPGQRRVSSDEVSLCFSAVKTPRSSSWHSFMVLKTTVRLQEFAPWRSIQKELWYTSEAREV